MTIFKKINIKIHFLVYFFIIYSFLGWCLETFYVSAAFGHFEKKGILNSPFCPIYGFGSLILIIFLDSMKDRPKLFFLCSVALTTTLEFFTGLIMRTAFHIIAWDYSSQALNLLGIISFRNSLMWGILSMLFIYKIHPFIVNIFFNMSFTVKRLIVSCLVLYFLIDISIVLKFYYR